MAPTADSFKRDPVDYVSLIEDAKIHTPSSRVTSHSEFDLTFTIHNGQQKVRFALEPNHDLFPDNLEFTSIDENGNEKTETIERTDFKVYRGKSFVQRDGEPGWSVAGWARIIVHQDGKKPIFDGSFRLDGNDHHVETGAGYRRVKHEQDPIIDAADDAMVVWRDSDIRSFSWNSNELKRSEHSDLGCDSDSLEYNSQYDLSARDFSPLQTMETHELFGRQSIDGGNGNDPAGNLIASIGSVSGCPTTKKVALVGIATDCNYYQQFNRSQDAIKKNIFSLVNRASEVYESTFKISLAVASFKARTEDNCPSQSASQATPWNIGCDDKSFDLAARLNAFSKWRGEQSDNFAYWTLFTTCATDTAVGLAWRGQLCRQGSAPNGGSNDTIAAANVVVNTPTEWQVFAHETGHTFGAVHDCVEQTCPVKSNAQTCCPFAKNSCDAGGGFMMNPSTGPNISKFSPCSVGNICSGLKGNVKSDCLTDNKNVKTVTGSQCGNGIVEPGEECDCGGEAVCGDNKCCDAKTCKFKTGAVCDPDNEDCCDATCKFAASTKVCRASTGDCDPEEKCPGDKASCPEDKHKDNGDSCGKGLECVSGTCTSRDRQCQVAAGDILHSNEAKACGNDCLLECESPAFHGGQCAFYNQYFMDGTSCTGGGRCKDGRCEGSSWTKEVADWYKNNKSIAIPVTVVVGGLILIALTSCIFSSIRRCLRRRNAPKPGGNRPPMGQNQWHPYRQGNQWGPNSAAPLASGGSGDNMNYNGGNFNNGGNFSGQQQYGNQAFGNSPHDNIYPPPPAPPPSYSYNRGPSTRYA